MPPEVASAYGIEAYHCERLGFGHINETFVVRDANGRYLMQAINHEVFKDPTVVMANLGRVLNALHKKAPSEISIGHAASDAAVPPLSRLVLLRTRDGEPFAEDEQRRLWRAFPYLAGTLSRTVPRHARDVQRTAAAFGAFQTHLRDLDPAELSDTIPHFHDTPHRFSQLDQATDDDASGRVAQSQEALALAARYRPISSRLIDLRDAGLVPTRVVHNDAKISNVLFDEATGEAVCVVDLDTVMAGLSLYDFGDMVRSMSHTAEEDERDLTRVAAQPPLFEALARGYVSSTRTLLNEVEKEHLFDAGLVLILEQAVRFLTDHLNGDRYFRITRDGHNLDRAHTQFRLVESMLAQEDEFRRLTRI